MSLFGAVLGGVGGFLTGGPAGAVAGVAAGLGLTGGGGGSSAPSGTPFPGAPSLPPDTTSTTSTSRVFGIPVSSHTTQTVTPGTNGTATNRIAGYVKQTKLAGGEIGFAPHSWAVRTRTIKGGEVVHKQMYRCPHGYVLARDGNCYPSGMLPRKWRKWAPRRKGPISYRNWEALKRADSARKTAARVAKKAGLKVRK